MRDIKFRGLGIDGKWWFGESRPSGERHVNLATFFANLHAGAIRPETVGEWTGLHDKNGKEIYEGDIVVDNIGHYLLPTEVELNWVWIHDFIEYSLSGNNLEVIGNIWENPELLRE
jgi:uncharacterized phage protein (TIGR01671 family)